MNTATELKQNVPSLRFPEFSKPWTSFHVGELLDRVGKPVKVVENEQYREIGIRSHGNGVFHKEATDGKSNNCYGRDIWDSQI